MVSDGVSGSWLLPLIMFLWTVAAVVGLVSAFDWAVRRRGRRAVGEQLARLEGNLTRGSEDRPALIRHAAGDPGGWLGSVARLPQLASLESLLQRAAVAWTVQGFLVRSAGFLLAMGLGGLIAFGPGLAMVGAAVVGGLGPYLRVRHRIASRMRAFEEQLPEAIDLMARAIRAGHPLAAALRMVADDAAQPIAGEFRQVFEEQRFGMPFEDSLLALTERIPLVDVRILATAMLIQREVGGNLAEILDNLSYVIRQRFTIRRQLLTITAEGRMSMWTLMALPPGVALVILILNPEYMMVLLRDPLGHLMLYAALAMQFVGYLWVRRIVDIRI